jgi:hypothetical protein
LATDYDNARQDEGPSLELFGQSDDPNYGYDNQWQDQNQPANAYDVNDVMNEEDEMGMFI